MKYLTPFFLFAPSMALAHPGHLTDVAGHDHIAAGVAIGVAIAVAIWGALRGRRDQETVDDAESTRDDEPQEA